MTIKAVTIALTISMLALPTLAKSDRTPSQVAPAVNYTLHGDAAMALYEQMLHSAPAADNNFCEGSTGHQNCISDVQINCTVLTENASGGDLSKFSCKIISK